MSNREVEKAKEEIYAYIHEIAQTHVETVVRLVDESPELTAIALRQAAKNIFDNTKEQFYGLLLSRNARGRAGIITALDVVTESPEFKGEGGLQFINRCFYSICNYWHLNAQERYITEHLRLLIQHLLDLPPLEAKGRSTRILQQRMHAFRKHHYTTYLQRQMHLDGSHKTGQVSDVLSDFPYLWGVTTHVSDNKKFEKNLRRTGVGKKQYERRLNDYKALVGYVRQCKEGAPNLAVPLPWNSSVHEFNQALIYFKQGPSGIFYPSVQKLEQDLTIEKDHQTVCPILYDYIKQICQDLPANVAKRYYRGIDRSFNDAVAKSTSGTGIGESGKINLFVRVLKVIFSPQSNGTGIKDFRQCLEIAGSRSMAGVLLGIVLGCPMARFKLEKMLGNLYECFETQCVRAAGWLVDFFQHINLALTVNARKLGYFELMDVNKKRIPVSVG